jgi:tetratricopeptide (TPR) repeat protein
MNKKSTGQKVISIISYDGLVYLYLLVTILAVYWQICNYDFVSFDDSLYVYNNSHVKAGLTYKSIRWAFGFQDIAYWHPLTWLSHMLDCQLYGLNPGMHHMTNLIIHIANSMLLFLTFKKMTGVLWPSAFIATLFALHPLNVETVAWVAERKNVLSTFFWILTMLTYVHYSRQKGLRRYLLTLLVFWFGLMCKPVLVTLPFALLLIDYWPLGRLRFKQREIGSNCVKDLASKYSLQESSVSYLILEKVPFIILSAVSVSLSILSAKQHGILSSTELVPIDLRIANALVSYVAYLGKLIWPQNLAVFYPFPTTIPMALTAGAGLTLICISFLIIRALREKPYLVVGWFWYLGTLLPSIGLMQAGLWPAMADRWTYVPAIGIFIIIAWSVTEFVARRQVKKSYVSIAVAAVIIILMAKTWSQSQHWVNSLALYKHAVNASANNHVAHRNLGATLYLKGEVNEATTHFIEALRIMPVYNEALANLRVSLVANGGIDQAIEKMKKLIKLYPENSGLYYNLGVMYGKKGKLDKALEQYEKALSYHSEFPQALFDLAYIYSIKGQYEKALTLFKKTIEIQSDLFWAYYNIAAILAIQNRVDESISWLDQAIKKGFRDWDFLVKDKKLENIRKTSYYKKLFMKS